MIIVMISIHVRRKDGINRYGAYWNSRRFHITELKLIGESRTKCMQVRLIECDLKNALGNSGISELKTLVRFSRWSGQRMNIAYLLFTAGYIFLFAITMQTYALDEIRSDIYNLSQNKVVLDGTNFPGFYYDIDDNTFNERLILRLSDVDRNCTDAVLRGQPDAYGNRGAVYITEAQPYEFDFELWGYYEEIIFLGESYFAAYDRNVTRSMEQNNLDPLFYDMSVDKNMLAGEQISKILWDDDDEIIISSSEPLQLEEGYMLRVKAIDSDGTKMHLELLKDGEIIDSGVVRHSDNSNAVDETYYYKKDVGNCRGLVIIGVHFKDIFGGSDQNPAVIDGIWQISENLAQLDANAKYGKMSIDEVNPNLLSIKMDNENENITLVADDEIQLTDNIWIRTADQDGISASNPLRYYIYKK